MERTTDLAIVRKDFNAFTWGRVHKIYDLTDYYTIVEFTPVVGGKIQPTAFHIYVEGQDTGQGSDSIEGAMLLAIAHGGFENKNTAGEMARAAAKLLEIEGV